MKELVARIGSFLVLIGLAILFLFVLSELADAPDFDYLFMAILVVGLGWMLRRRSAPPRASGRFAWLRQRRATGRNTKKGETPPEGDEVS